MKTANEAASTASEVPLSGVRAGPDRRRRWLAAAALLLVGATVAALRQDPRGDPYRPPQTVAWWLSPVEKHATRRLPVIDGDVHDLWAAADGSRLWAVGSGGLLLRSDDGGRNWAQVILDGDGQEPVAEKPAARAVLALPGGSIHADPLAGTGTLGTEPDSPPEQSGPSLEDPKRRRDPSALEQQVSMVVGEQAEVTLGYLRPGWQDRGTFQPLREAFRIGLWAVHFSDAEHGWLAGSGGNLLRTVDGGRSWELRRWSPPPGVAPPRVRDVLFPDERFGCILLADDSTTDELIDGLASEAAASWMAVTRDGGETWTVVTRTRSPRLRSRADTCLVVQGNREVAVDPRTAPDSTVDAKLDGDLVDVLPSGDGVLWRLFRDGRIEIGENGDPVPAPPAVPRSLVHAGEDGSLWVLAETGQLFHTVTREGPWTEVPMPDHLRPTALTVIPANGTAVAASGGMLVLSPEAGAPVVTTSDGDYGVTALQFFDERRGVAAGSGPDRLGFIRLTSDGGRSWWTVSDALAGPVEQMGFVDEGFGWAALESGPPLYSTDGGETWDQRGDVPFDRVVDLRFIDAANGLLVGPGGELATTDLGGRTWSLLPRRAEDDPELASTVDFTMLEDRIEVTGVATNGTLYRLTVRPDRPHEYVPLGLDTAPAVRRGARVGEELVLGGGGGLVRLNGSKTVPITTRPTLSFFFLDPVRGWLAEPGGALYRTVDGGRTWHDLTPYRFWPAPWYWLAVFLSVALLVPAVAPPPTHEVRRTVVEMAVSDRPIDKGDADPLRFDEVALGLSRFLRNTATQPPLTLAVTGEWGSGKSSLMNLLRADLSRYRFRPVWFNAWHHQKEEQLLAALLENIRRQAVPSWLRPEGWIFRARLLARRLRRWWPLAVVLALAFGGLTGWIAVRGERSRNLLQKVAATLEAPLQWLIALAGGSPPASDTPQTAVLALVASGSLIALTLYRGLRAFGVKPASLIAGLSMNARLRDAEAQTGFRYRFAREFQDVTEALAPRTLTVFIDDLDRCRPQNALDVLEAVNFLVTSGDCYVVLGMDLERVERYIGFGFREIADEIPEEESGETGTGERQPRPAADAENGGVVDPHRRRAAFARQYLEKLINIEVPVPRGSSEENLQLLQRRVREEPEGRRRHVVRRLRGLAGRWWLLPSLVPLALLLGLWLGSLQAATRTGLAEGTLPKTSGFGVQEIEGATETEAPVPAAETGEQSSPSLSAEAPPSIPAVLLPGEPLRRPHLPFWLLSGLLVAGVGAWILTTLPQVEVRDSEEFTGALEAWFPLLYAGQPTPRSLKRFLNRVRYYAMRQRSSEPPKSRLTVPLEAVRRWLDRLPWFPTAAADAPPPAPADLEQAKAIPEEILVALAAIEHTHSEWLRDPGFWRDPVAYLDERREPEGPGRESELDAAVLRLGASDARRTLRDHQRRFETLSRGIETR